jgi:hypothetical protein
LIWFVTIIILVVCPFTGVSFILDTVYGTDAIILMAMSLAVGFWWIYIPTFLYIMIFAALTFRKPIYKKYNYKKFSLCLIVAIFISLLAVTAFNVLQDIKYNNSWFERGYSDVKVISIPYSDDYKDELDTATTLDYDQLFEYASKHENQELFDVILGFQENYTTYSVIVSPIINGTIFDYKASSLEIKGNDEEARINVEYAAEDSEEESIIVIIADSFSVDDYKFSSTFTRVKELAKY